MAMKIYNTYSRSLEEFKPINPKKVTFYSCGPTVYNFAHIGNLRTFIFYDILRRSLKFDGYGVEQVTNITDVDDKTIKNSIETGTDLKTYTETYTKYFFEDLDRLNIERADRYPLATENIDEMQKIISGLLKKEYAYEAKDGVYYSVSKFDNYGKLSGAKMGEGQSRIAKDEYDKENAADFALWKYWDESDGKVFWRGDLKKGRPGWHIECSAMAIKYLGETIDLHAGAVDLIFPHHDNEIAQSEAYTGKKFVNYWMHGEHLLVNGQKMSKSLGNFYTLRDLQEQGYDPLAFRLMILDSHYRSKVDFTFDSLKRYSRTLQRIDTSMRALEVLEKKEAKEEDLVDVNDLKNRVGEAMKKFKDSIENDIDTHTALEAFFSILDLVDFRIDKGEIIGEEYTVLKDAITRMNSILGIETKYEIPQEIIDLAKQRQALRKDKKWSESDLIRNQIESKGYHIIDVNTSSVIVKIA